MERLRRVPKIASLLLGSRQHMQPTALPFPSTPTYDPSTISSNTAPKCSSMHDFALRPNVNDANAQFHARDSSAPSALTTLFPSVRSSPAYCTVPTEAHSMQRDVGHSRCSPQQPTSAHSHNAYAPCQSRDGLHPQYHFQAVVARQDQAAYFSFPSTTASPLSHSALSSPHVHSAQQTSHFHPPELPPRPRVSTDGSAPSPTVARAQPPPCTPQPQRPQPSSHVLSMVSSPAIAAAGLRGAGYSTSSSSSSSVCTSASASDSQLLPLPSSCADTSTAGSALASPSLSRSGGGRRLRYSAGDADATAVPPRPSRTPVFLRRSRSQDGPPPPPPLLHASSAPVLGSAKPAAVALSSTQQQQQLLHQQQAQLSRTGNIMTVLRSAFAPAESNDALLQELHTDGVSVVSDVDDSIKITEVHSVRSILVNTFLKKFRAVPGMAEWFEWLRATHGAQFHYVSASPDALCAALRDFVLSEGFPHGTFHLRRSASFSALTSTTSEHKLSVIVPLIARYPRRRWILVGDSGEQDPEIFAQVASLFPSSIRLIAIRKVESGNIAYNNAEERFHRLFTPVGVRWCTFGGGHEARAWCDAQPDFLSLLAATASAGALPSAPPPLFARDAASMPALPVQPKQQELSQQRSDHATSLARP